MRFLVKKMLISETTWNKETYEEFLNYLVSLTNTVDKVKRRETIINTNLKVLAIYNKPINDITKEIRKTDIIAFLDLVQFKYYEESMIFGLLLPYLSDFDQISKYLDILSKNTDNWATCDNIPFKLIVKKYEEELFFKSQVYIESEQPFIRRIGFKILFEYINRKNYNSNIFSMIDMFSNEVEYYVNMILGWLLCEVFVKAKDETYEYLKNTKLNNAALKIFVQKCRDSYRVDSIDKELLLKYKK